MDANTISVQSCTSLTDYLNLTQIFVENGQLEFKDFSDQQLELELPSAGTSASGGVASVRSVANKSVLNKSSLNKNKNKNKNKTTAPVAVARSGTLVPTAALLRLHRAGTGAMADRLPADWTRIRLAPPPGPDKSRLETSLLMAMQENHKARKARIPDILTEASLDISSFTRPLGIDGLAGFIETEALFLELLTVCEYIGLYYKAAFGRLRPNQVEPRLRPVLPNPAHEAYPSNHSFQCHSIAYAFNAILPEHPATQVLSDIALNVAQNREWAGLHYPSDTKAGKQLARCFAPLLAEAFADRFRAVQQEWI